MIVEFLNNRSHSKARYMIGYAGIIETFIEPHWVRSIFDTAAELKNHIDRSSMSPYAYSCCAGKNPAVWNPHLNWWECSVCKDVKSNDPSYLYGGTSVNYLPLVDLPNGYSIPKDYPVKSCDCGAIKCNTTHANWCSTNG